MLEPKTGISNKLIDQETPEAQRYGNMSHEFKEYDQNLQAFQTSPKSIDITPQLSFKKRDMKFEMPKDSISPNQNISDIYYSESPSLDDPDLDIDLESRNQWKNERFNKIRNSIEKNEKYQESYYHVMKYFQHQFKKTKIPNNGIKVDSPWQIFLDQGVYVKKERAVSYLKAKYAVSKENKCQMILQILDEEDNYLSVRFQTLITKCEITDYCPHPSFISTKQVGNNLQYFKIYNDDEIEHKVEQISLDLVTLEESVVKSFFIARQDDLELCSVTWLEDFEKNTLKDEDQLIVFCHRNSLLNVTEVVEVRALDNVEKCLLHQEMELSLPCFGLMRQKDCLLIVFACNYDKIWLESLVYEVDAKAKRISQLELSYAEKEQLIEKHKTCSHKSVFCQKVSPKGTVTRFDADQSHIMKLIDTRIELCSILISEEDVKVFMNSPEEEGGIQMIEQSTQILQFSRVDELSTINELLAYSEIQHCISINYVWKNISNQICSYTLDKDFQKVIINSSKDKFNIVRANDFLEKSPMIVNLFPWTIGLKLDIKILDEITKKANKNTLINWYQGFGLNSVQDFCDNILTFYYLDENRKIKSSSHSLQDLDFLKGCQQTKTVLHVINKRYWTFSENCSRITILFYEPKIDDLNGVPRGSNVYEIQGLHLAILDVKTKEVLLHFDMNNIFLVPFYTSRNELSSMAKLRLEQTSEIQHDQNGRAEVFYTIQVRYDQLKIIQLFEIKIEGAYDGMNIVQEQIYLHAIKLLALKDEIRIITQNPKRFTGNFHPLLDQKNQIVGCNISFVKGDDILCLPIMNKKGSEFKYKNEAYAYSDQTEYEHGTLYQAIITQDWAKKLNSRDIHTILRRTIRVHMNMVQLDLRHHIKVDKDIDIDFYSPQEMFEGNSFIHYVISDPDKAQLIIMDYKKKKEKKLAKSSIMRILQNNDQRIKLFSSSDIGFLIKNEIDNQLDIDQVSVLLRLLKDHNNLSAITVMKHMLEQNYDPIRYDILMGCVPEILKQDKGIILAKFFYKLDSYSFEISNLNQQLKINCLFPAKMRHKLKEFLDEPLIVQHICLNNMNQKNQYLSIGSKFIEIDNNNSEHPEYKVIHSYIDWSQLILQQKLDGDFSSFTLYKIAQLMQDIEEQTHGLVEDQIIFKDMVDFIYEQYTFPYFKLMFFIYLFGFILPFVIQKFFTKSETVLHVCEYICLATLTVMLAVEVIQIKTTSFMYHFKNFWNVFDTFSLAVNYYYLSFRINYEYDEELEKSVFMIVLYVLIIFLSFMQILFYLRIYESYGKLIMLIELCLRDCMEFLVFIIGWILFFFLFNHIAEVQYDHDDYPMLSHTTVTLLQTYRNSIGDINTPKYPAWEVYLNYTDTKPEGLQKRFEGHVMVCMIWFMWILHQFVITIMLMNFLIALISQSYEMVISKSAIYKYKQRVELNLEALTVIDQFKTFDPLNTLIVISNSYVSDLDSPDQAWQGFVASLKTYIGKMSRKQRETNDKNTEKIVQKVDKLQKQIEKQNLENQERYDKIIQIIQNQ